MRTCLSAVAMIALAGACSQAGAQAQCPELTRLRNEAVEASKPMTRALMSSRCDAYVRASLAWAAAVDYARNHQDVCDISNRVLSDLEKYHLDSVTARNNVCAGRPVRPFPADVVLQ